MPKKNSKFCNRECYAEGYRKGVITNRGLFKEGMPSINKGKIVESRVGEERAADIRMTMSRNSIEGKIPTRAQCEVGRPPEKKDFALVPRRGRRGVGARAQERGLAPLHPFRVCEGEGDA